MECRTAASIDQQRGNFSCAADGAERKFIKDNFTGAPFRLNSTTAMIWRGDWARFIADNL